MLKLYLVGICSAIILVLCGCADEAKDRMLPSLRASKGPDSCYSNSLYLVCRPLKMRRQEGDMILPLRGHLFNTGSVPICVSLNPGYTLFVRGADGTVSMEGGAGSVRPGHPESRFRLLKPNGAAFIKSSGLTPRSAVETHSVSLDKSADDARLVTADIIVGNGDDAALRELDDCGLIVELRFVVLRGDDFGSVALSWCVDMEKHMPGIEVTD